MNDSKDDEQRRRQAVHARLVVMADHVARYREDVAAMVVTLDGERSADAVAAAIEAERALRSADRSLRRAATAAAQRA